MNTCIMSGSYLNNLLPLSTRDNGGNVPGCCMTPGRLVQLSLRGCRVKQFALTMPPSALKRHYFVERGSVFCLPMQFVGIMAGCLMAAHRTANCTIGCEKK